MLSLNRLMSIHLDNYVRHLLANLQNYACMTTKYIYQVLLSYIVLQALPEEAQEGETYVAINLPTSDVCDCPHK